MKKNITGQPLPVIRKLKWFYFLLLIAPCIFLVTGCQKNMADQAATESRADGQSDLLQKKYGSDVATDWYNLQFRFLLKKNSSLPHNMYFSYIGIGLYESVRYINPNSKSFSEVLNQMPAMPSKEGKKSYNWQISGNAAMAGMVRLFYKGLSAADSASIDSLEEVYNNKTVCTSKAEFNRSQAFGYSIAQAVYNWSLTDDFNPSNAGYTPPVFPGAWVPTPPAFVNPPVQPYVGTAHTFMKENANIAAPPFPAAYSEDPASDFYKIVKEVYDVFQTLTTEQKNIALYWVDTGDGLGLTTGGHEFSIITQVIRQNNVSLRKAAEAYAKAGIAERDAIIVCFRSKYKYTLIRPVSYAQKVFDPGWLPYITTPPHPEYPAAHAMVTGAVMQAASGVLGNHVAFTDHSYDFRGWTPRSYNSLFDAAKEAGISRLYGGIHYHVSINTGLNMGKIMGSKIGLIDMH